MGPTLIIGADGTIGEALLTAFKRAGQKVVGTTRRSQERGEKLFFDLENPAFQDLSPFARNGRAILCSGVTSIDRCEREPIETRRINVENTVDVARHLVDAGIFTVFLSSNAVFDGQKPFQKVEDRTNPQTEYGRQKIEAERQLLELGELIAIVRLSKIVSAKMPLFVKWVSDLRAGHVIRPFTDAFVSPLSTLFVVNVIRQIIGRRAAGITQASASEDMSYASVARYLTEKIGGAEDLVQPVSCQEQGIARFPRHTTLDDFTLRSIGLKSPTPTEALDYMIYELPHGLTKTHFAYSQDLPETR